MGEIANKMINGELCQWCGVYLEPEETVYQVDENGENPTAYEMPADGTGFGVPVICEHCKDQ